MESILDSTGAYRVEVGVASWDYWARCVEDLAKRGVPVPFEHTPDWLESIERDDYWFVVVRESATGCLSAAFPMRRQRLRLLPGDVALRLTYFGYATDDAALESCLEVLPKFMAKRPGLVRLNVESFTARRGRQQRVEKAARKMGYTQVRPQHRYRYTVRLGLSPSADHLMASFSASCRRNIRQPTKKGFAIEPITESKWANRMGQLWAETFARTGVRPPERRWRDHLALGARTPDLYHIVGTFGPGYPKEESLVAFACAHNNGDHALYADAASTRDVPGTVPLVYAPLWALIQWSKEQGCAWFDMGGVAAGAFNDDADRRRSIADFKLRFTDEVLDVGAEWRFDPGSFRAAVSNKVNSWASLGRHFLNPRGG